jgi:hypothetical protein
VLSGDGDRRPHVDVTERGTVVVRGANLLASSSANAPAAAVECVEIPLDVWASIDELVFATELTADAFENEFDRVAETAFRLETRQDYAGATGPRYEFWQRGEQMPERSPQTSGWLARVASSTAQGKRWQRVHVVDLPLSEYMRYELVVYAENAAAGEDIRIVERAAHPTLELLREDYWLFDADDPSQERAIFLEFDTGGYPIRYERTCDSGRLVVCRWQRDLVWSFAVPLAEFVRGRSRHS